MITYIIKKIVLGPSIKGEKAFVSSNFRTVIESKEWNPDLSNPKGMATYNKWCKQFKFSALY